MNALDLVALTCIGDMDDFWFALMGALPIRDLIDHYNSEDARVACALFAADYHEEDY